MHLRDKIILLVLPRNTRTAIELFTDISDHWQLESTLLHMLRHLPRQKLNSAFAAILANLPSEHRDCVIEFIRRCNAAREQGEEAFLAALNSYDDHSNN